MALNKQDRIRGVRAMKAVFTRAAVVNGRDASLRVLRTSTGKTTFAVIVPTTVSKIATQRNRLKRRGSECLRLILKQHNTATGMRVVVLIRRDMNQETLHSVLVSLLMKSGILLQ